MPQEAKMSDVIYVRWSDDGQHIRKWSREPFEGGEPMYSRSFLLSEERVEAGREAILENLRDRRLLKWLFAEDPDNHGAIGYVDGPIDAETQNECAGSLARAALTAAMGGDPPR